MNTFKTLNIQNEERKMDWQGDGLDSKVEYIYFVRAGTSAIKIGLAVDIDKRLNGLQTGNHENLILLAAIPSNRVRFGESTLHRAFKDYHIRGEWYYPARELLAFIGFVIDCCKDPKKWKLIDEYVKDRLDELSDS